MLVDAGGTHGGGFDIGQHVIVPFLWHEWVGHLDVLALTHPQSDHIGGAPTILRTLSVGEVWTGAGPALSPTDLWIQEYLRRRRIPHRVVVAGDAPFRMGDAVIEVLHPDAESMAATRGCGTGTAAQRPIVGPPRASGGSGGSAHGGSRAGRRGGAPTLRCRARRAGDQGSAPRVSPAPAPRHSSGPSGRRRRCSRSGTAIPSGTRIRRSWRGITRWGSACGERIGTERSAWKCGLETRACGDGAGRATSHEPRAAT